jgi:hypothetical protein
MTLSKLQTDFTFTPGGFSGGASAMYSTRQWTPIRSHFSGAQFLCLFGASDTHALLLDTGSIRPEWHSARTAPAAEHLCFWFEQIGSTFRWNFFFDAIDIVELKALPDSRNLLDVALAEGNDRVSSDALLEFMEGLFDLTHHKKIDQIEWLLKTADPSRLAPEISVGLLRATAHLARSLSFWEQYYEATYDELTNRKLNADKILVGIGRGVGAIAQKTRKPTFQRSGRSGDCNADYPRCDIATSYWAVVQNRNF